MKNKKLWYLTKQSLNRKIKSKWFIVVNVLLAILIIGLINIDTIISAFGGKFNETTEILVIDNTNATYDILVKNLEDSKNMLEDISNFEIKKYDKSIDEAKKEVKKDNKVLVVLDNSDTNYMSAKIISNDSIDTMLYQTLANSITSTKEVYALSLSNIDANELARVTTPIEIEREFLNEESADTTENMQMIMSTVLPILILPFFMLSLFLVQMIGAEVNDEKTTRGMEIIISNVSPKTHFFSKVIAGNLFVFIQAFLLLLSGGIGMIIRNKIGTSSLVNTNLIDVKGFIDILTASGMIDKIWIILIFTVILLILTFLAYSLVAGVLASMTTNTEDYQQVQTPIIIISLAGYYLAMMAALFNGSLFIRIMSYVPFISSLLSPALFLMGQITIIDVLISIGLMVVTVILLIKYGLRIYKVGILNYSSNGIWKKIFGAIKK